MNFGNEPYPPIIDNLRRLVGGWEVWGFAWDELISYVVKVVKNRAELPNCKAIS